MVQSKSKKYSLDKKNSAVDDWIEEYKPHHNNSTIENLIKQLKDNEADNEALLRYVVEYNQRNWKEVLSRIVYENKDQILTAMANTWAWMTKPLLDKQE